MLASRCVSLLKPVLSFALDFFLIVNVNVKMTLTQMIANDCSVNHSDLSKMLVKKQLKYFDVPLDHAWKVPVLQELLHTRTNNLNVEEFKIAKYPKW